MSNIITIELCAEDRARLDRIIEALGNHHNCEHCVSAAITMTKAAQAEAETPTAEANEPAPTTITPQEETPAETPTEHPLDAPPIEVDEPTAPEAPKVEPSEVRSKVVDLCSKGKKAEAKAIIEAYAPSVSELLKLPADKIAEAYAKLNALEG